MSEPWSVTMDAFAEVPHVMVSVKRSDGRYLRANHAFVRRARRRREQEVIGRRAGELFPPTLAQSYEAQDESVIRTGVAVRNQLEVIPGPDGAAWYLTSKVISHFDGMPFVVAVSTVAQLTGRALGLRAALDYLHSHLDRNLSVGELAAVAEMSTDQLERATRRVLGTSPKQLIMRARVEYAARLIATTDDALAVVASRCGFYDQPQFTRQFKSAIGLTPGEYRTRDVR